MMMMDFRPSFSFSSSFACSCSFNSSALFHATGCSCSREGEHCWRESLPTDSHGEGSLAPVPPCDYGHLALCVGARAVEYLVRVAVFGGVEFVGVGVGMGMGRETIVTVGHFFCGSHIVLFCQLRWSLVNDGSGEGVEAGLSLGGGRPEIGDKRTLQFGRCKTAWLDKILH